MGGRGSRAFVAFDQRPDYDVQDGITTRCLGRSGIAYALGDVDTAVVSGRESFRMA